MTFYSIPNTRLFASCYLKSRDQRWTPDTVRRIADNARKLHRLGLHTPSVGFGHEDDGEPTGTDEPSAGVVDPRTVRAVPDPENPGESILEGSLVNIPEDVADEIEAGLWTRGSAELYSNFHDDFGRPMGPALRRFSLLGFEPPQLKRLGKLGQPVPQDDYIRFAESRGRVHEVRNGRAVYAYAERRRPPPNLADPAVASMAAWARHNFARLARAGWTPGDAVQVFAEARRLNPATRPADAVAALLPSHVYFSEAARPAPTRPRVVSGGRIRRR